MLNGNKGLLTQAIDNIVSNSLKYCPQDSRIIITSGIVKEKQMSKNKVIEIAQNILDISEAKINKVINKMKKEKIYCFDFKSNLFNKSICSPIGKFICGFSPKEK